MTRDSVSRRRAEAVFVTACLLLAGCGGGSALVGAYVPPVDTVQTAQPSPNPPEPDAGAPAEEVVSLDTPTPPPESAVPPVAAAPSDTRRFEKLGAYKIFKGDSFVGSVGDGPGPFVSKRHSGLPFTWLEHARYTSFLPSHEARISEILARTTSFAEVVKRLRKAGYRLEPQPYLELFAPPDESATGDPAADPMPIF